MTQRDKDYRAGHKRRQGPDWIVVWWDPKRDAWIEEYPMHYFRACELVRELREEARETEGKS